MTTPAKIAANRRNARLSTGPRTTDGRATSRLNAVRHGLRSAAPVVPGEDVAVWERFRDGVTADLSPVGVLEEELADRVALLAWRLRRVAAFEAAVITATGDRAARLLRGDGIEPDDDPPDEPGDRPPTVDGLRAELATCEELAEDAEREARLLADLATSPDDAPIDGADAYEILGGLPAHLPGGGRRQADAATTPSDPAFLRAVGVPAEWLAEPDGWDGWTAGLVRRGATLVAGRAKWDGARLLARTTAAADAERAEARERVQAVRQQLERAERAAQQAEAEARRRALVPATAVAVVTRYEGQLQRLLAQAMHELERVQARRSGAPCLPPAVLDVTVHPALAAPPALPGG